MLFKYLEYSFEKTLVNMYSRPYFIGKYMMTNKYLQGRDNTSVRKMYERVGFTIDKSYLSNDKKIYLYYKK